MKAQTFTKETIRSLGQKDRSFPEFQIGDTIAVMQKISEGNAKGEVKERIQTFEGDVIAISNNGASSTFTVRRIGANSVSVERIYPFQSPMIDSIKFIRSGKVRRAKLYYLRDRVGRAARVQEKIMTKEQKVRAQAARAHKTVTEETVSTDSE